MDSLVLTMKILALIFCFSPVLSLFQIPEVQIQAIDPKGFRASINAIRGVQSFGFHAKLGDAGKYINGDDVREAKDGRFTFSNTDVKIKIGDVLKYWVFVKYDDMGFRKDNQAFIVRKLVLPDTPFPPLATVNGNTDFDHCEPSLTTAEGEVACEGHLIFEETFETPTLNTERWTIEQRLPSEEQECEFVSYQKGSVKIVNGTLQITPTLLSEHKNGREMAKKLDFKEECTAKISSECKMESEYHIIVPPVISGKITTMDKFSFKYGRIQIKAKFPQGDWIYPELYLEPYLSKYGLEGYNSGMMRIAFARGNLKLKSINQDYGNKRLSGGIILDQSYNCRKEGTKTSKRQTQNWGNDYHVYGLTWNKDSIVLDVDNEQYGEIKPTNGFKSYLLNGSCDSGNNLNLWDSGTNFAPFDQEFYITIGVGVGGISDFPDSVKKPWNNTDPKAQFTFMDDVNNWHSTWEEYKKDLHVESIRVWAL